MISVLSGPSSAGLFIMFVVLPASLAGLLFGVGYAFGYVMGSRAERRIAEEVTKTLNPSTLQISRIPGPNESNPQGWYCVNCNGFNPAKNNLGCIRCGSNAC